MKTTRNAALATAFTLLLAAGCGGGEGGGRSGGGPPWGGARPPAVVSTAPVEQGAFSVEAEFVGSLEARTAADLYARTSGPIVEMHADQGDRVREGQLLARIQPDEAEKQVEQARAALRIAEATLSQRRANLEIARSTARRTESLFEQDLVSQQDYDAVQADLVGAEAQLELARAQIEQARANVSAAELDLEKTRVVAPFDGWIGKRYLGQGDFAATNRPVFSVVDLSTIRTTISITESDAGRIHVGQPARLTTGAYPGEVFEGRVARIASVFDPQTNTAEAEVEVDNSDARLKPGLFANVAVTYRTEPTALLVPASAVVEGETASHLYVAERDPGGGEGAGGSNGPAPPAGPRPAVAGPSGDGGAPPGWVAHRVVIRVVGTGAGGTVAVEPAEPSAPLDAGSRVVVLGQQQLSDGAPITLGGEGPASGPSPEEPREGSHS